MKRLYVASMPNGEQYGVPAEVIADNYAKYREGRGENYQENFETFDANDFEFADWAKNNMDWGDVEDKAILIRGINNNPAYQDGWVNGDYQYMTISEIGERE